MRPSETVSWALVVGSVVISVVLWRELRAERQLVADMREQQDQVIAPVQEPAQTAHLPIAATSVPAVAVPTPEPVPVAPAVSRAPPPAIPVVPPPIDPTSGVISESQRAVLIAQSDANATGLALIWRDRLEVAGLPMTTEQLQALNAAAIAERRLEALENLELQSAVRPTDMESVFRLREEALNRSHEHNLEILRVASPQLTDAQVRALRSQFDAGHEGRIKALQAERVQAINANPTR
jgi:sulfite reductase alpha subunit-like flavoprotein